MPLGLGDGVVRTPSLPFAHPLPAGDFGDHHLVGTGVAGELLVRPVADADDNGQIRFQLRGQ